jgi:hypothetical protein
MGTIQTAETKRIVQKFYIENSLLRIAGVLFCHDAKRARKHSGVITLRRETSASQIVIRPDPSIGQPGPLAHKIFVALLKKHSDYGKPIRKEISFTRREIGRLIGRARWGGKDSENLARALHEIQHTFVTAHFKSDNGRLVEHSFNIFPEILIERREFASDPIETCSVTLAEPIVASLADAHFTCLNHDLMTRLSTIAQALYMRLFFQFAIMHAGSRRAHLKFQKRYDDVCLEWLGGLTVLRHPSKILREQLGTHLQQLADEGFLTSFELRDARSRPGFIISFSAGPQFFGDYDRFYRSGLAIAHAEASTREPKTAEPLRVAYLFAERRAGHPVGKVAYVPSRDVETAKELLSELPFPEMSNFIDFALRQADRTNFAIQTLGGTKQYLADYLASRTRHAAEQSQKAADRAREEEEAERSAFNADRRKEARRMFTALPLGEREEIERLATAKASAFQGSLRGSMLEFNKLRLTIERHPDKLTTFAQWQSRKQ